MGNGLSIIEAEVCEKSETGCFRSYADQIFGWVNQGKTSSEISAALRVKKLKPQDQLKIFQALHLKLFNSEGEEVADKKVAQIMAAEIIYLAAQKEEPEDLAEYLKKAAPSREVIESVLQEIKDKIPAVELAKIKNELNPDQTEKTGFVSPQSPRTAIPRLPKTVANPILINQVYYLSGHPKRALFKAERNITAGKYEVVDLGNNRTVLRGDLKALGQYLPWGNDYYYQVDFSAVEAPGKYKIKITGDNQSYESETVYIGDQKFAATLQDAARFFDLMKCGVEIAGYHAACHLDDAAGKATGGWHDAGDWNKYIYTQFMPVYALIRMFEATKDPQYLNQARWGAEYLGKMVKPDGSMWSAVVYSSSDTPNEEGSYPIDWHFVPAEEETNNVPGTSDDRVLSPAQWGDPGWAGSWCSAVFAMLALYASGAEKEKYLALAKKTNDFYRQTFSLVKVTSGEQFQELGGLALSDLFLYKLTAENQYYADAQKQIKEMLTLQNQDKGYFHVPGQKEPFFNDYSIYLFVEAMATYRHLFPADQLSADIKKSIVALADKHLLYLAANTPYRQVQWRDDDDQLRPNGRLTENFYPPQNYMQGVSRGNSSYLLASAEAGMIAYQETHDTKYRDLAVDQLNWIFGINPFNLSLMEGHGTYDPASWHNRLGVYENHPDGAIPGAIANGIGSKKSDQPFFDLKVYPKISIMEAPAWQTNEPWLPHNAWFLMVGARILEEKEVKK